MAMAKAVLRRFASMRSARRRLASTANVARTYREDAPATSTADFYAPVADFAALGARDDVAAALAAAGASRPSHAQAVAFLPLLRGEKSEQLGKRKDVLLADRAGGGKTLAYLAPLLQAVVARESARGKRAQHPSVVVVVPTGQLASQVRGVLRLLSQGGLRVRCMAATGGRPIRTQREALQEGIDVVVGTPQRLLALHDDGSLDLGDVFDIVFDEADVLLRREGGFREDALLLRAMAGYARAVFITATMPAQTLEDLREDLGDKPMEILTGPGVHRVPKGLQERLVDCSGGDEISEESGIKRKANALATILESEKHVRTLVFCNKIETARKVENLLKRRDRHSKEYQLFAYHAAVGEEKSSLNLERFLRPMRQLEPQRVLISTDRASRGIDTAGIDHVVLFDLPREPSEYVRRAGRTARGAQGEGLVTVLALGRHVPIARNLIMRNQRGEPIHPPPEATR